MAISPVDNASAGTVSRICWNGIAHLLERYRASAGTVSRICWNGIGASAATA